MGSLTSPTISKYDMVETWGLALQMVIPMSSATMLKHESNTEDKHHHLVSVQMLE